jgi:CheY-like chemotaxis protein
MINYNSEGDIGHNRNYRILIVDDEPDICLTFKSAIEGHNGFEVDAYESPHEALKNFKASKYDLVLLDIKMPSMNGFQLYSEIKKIDNRVMALFITAAEMYYQEFRNKEGHVLKEVGEQTEGEVKEEKYGNGEYRQYCKFNENMFLQKPISITDLLIRINHILGIKSTISISDSF